MNNHLTDLPALVVKQLNGSEHFSYADKNQPQNVLSFWSWAYSNLAGNNLRGHLAEFIVASALNETRKARIEWAAYDIRTQSGIRIEVKSAAYLQSWSQARLSPITFGIAPTRPDNIRDSPKNKDAARNSDIYVFCLLANKSKQNLDPINLNQWEFYILPTRTLDERLGNQKTLSLGGLLKLNPVKCLYGEIAPTIERIFDANKEAATHRDTGDTTAQRT